MEKGESLGEFVSKGWQGTRLWGGGRVGRDHLELSYWQLCSFQTSKNAPSVTISQLTCHRRGDGSSPLRWWPPEASGWRHWTWEALCKSRRNIIQWEQRQVICSNPSQMVVHRKQISPFVPWLPAQGLVAMHQQPSQRSVVGADSLSLLPRAQLWNSASVHP